MTSHLRPAELFVLSGVRERIDTKQHPARRPIMSTATLDIQSTDRAADMPVLLAVSYLRVSTREQAERGGTEEGFSDPRAT